MARRSRDGEVCRPSGGGASAPLCTRRNPSANFRCGNTSQSRFASQLPSRGAFPLRRRTPKPLLEERWHGEAVTERCAAHRAAARQRPSAHAETLQQTFGAATPLSLASRASSPQGEPPLSGDGPQSLFWRGDPKEAPYCVLGFCGNRSRFRMRLRGIRFSCGGNFLWLMQAGCILVTTMAYGRVGREGAPEYGGQNGYFL